MGVLKKIFKFNLTKIDKAIEKDKKIRKHKLMSNDEFMFSFNKSQERIDQLRNSIQNTKL